MILFFIQTVTWS